MEQKHLESFVDIHCHLLPEIDDGAKSLEESLEMARLAVSEGIRQIIVTPHQLGNYSVNDGKTIRRKTLELQQVLHDHGIPLTLSPGADVRIEGDMVRQIKRGNVLTLADKHKHVLLELPHELYFPLEPVLEQLRRVEMTGILSHPERNRGIIERPELLPSLVQAGCLMQVTAGSLTGTFGETSRQLSEWMVTKGLVHFIATDAHGIRARRPLMLDAFEQVIRLSDRETAVDICCGNPARVVNGESVELQRRKTNSRGWFNWLKAS